MKTRTVYRYENVFGRGPYRGATWYDASAWDCMCDSHANMQHPTWALDFDIDQFEGFNRRDYLAACDSRESLNAWFDGWHDVLRANGFKVVEYTVPAENVADSISGTQVAFRKV